MFTFQGRLSRQDFWLALVGAILLSFGVMLVSGMAMMLLSREIHPLLEIPFSGVLIVLCFGNLWVVIAAQVKRWHDLDRSGWWTLLSLLCVFLFIAIQDNVASPTSRVLLHLIPIAMLCGVVGVLGFVNGTRGNNRFGADSVSAASTSKRFELQRPFSPVEFYVPQAPRVVIVDRKTAHLEPPQAPEPTTRCRNCDSSVPTSMRFCGQCGAAMPIAEEMPAGLELVEDPTPHPLDVKIEESPDWIVEDEPPPALPMLKPYGRFSRQDYWITWAIISVCNVAVMLVFAMIAHFLSDPKTVVIVEFFELVFTIWLYALELWVLTMAMIKRWHDLDRSGWHASLCYIPVIGILLATIYLGFVPGTKGPNRFGNDPVAVRKVY